MAGWCGDPGELGEGEAGSQRPWPGVVRRAGIQWSGEGGGGDPAACGAAVGVGGRGGVTQGGGPVVDNCHHGRETEKIINQQGASDESKERYRRGCWFLLDRPTCVACFF